MNNQNKEIREQQKCIKLKALGKFFWRFKYEILGLLNCMIGSLLIHLPYQAYVSGWLTTIIGMIIGGFFNWLSCYFYVIHQHDDLSIGKGFQEHYTNASIGKFCYYFYNLSVIVNCFIAIIQYLKLIMYTAKFLLNITDNTMNSIKIEIIIYFVTFIVIFIILYNKRNIQFMAWTFFATIIYCFFLIAQAINNSQNQIIHSVKVFQIDHLSSMAIALNQGFTIQFFCFQFLKRSEAFEKQHKYNDNSQHGDQPRLPQESTANILQNQRQFYGCCKQKNYQFNKHHYNKIILFTYIAGFIFYCIIAFAGNFAIYGRAPILGIQTNLQNTILHYYSYNSYQGITISVLIIIHFLITYPEYLLIMIDLMNRLCKDQLEITNSYRSISKSESKLHLSLIPLKDFILIFLCVTANTIINYFLTGISIPFFLKINGSIMSFIVLFFIPFLEHFSELNQTRRDRQCIYLQQRNYLESKKVYRRFLIFLNILMNIFGIFCIVGFVLKIKEIIK